MSLIQDLLNNHDSVIRQKTTADSISTDNVADQFDNLANELLRRGLISVNDTIQLQTQRGSDTNTVLVNGIGLFAYSPTGTPNNTTIFAALGGGVWSLVLGAGQSLTPQLDAPTGFGDTSVTSSTITIGWNLVTEATNYVLERSSDGFSGWVEVYNGSSNSFVDGGFNPSTTYYYRLRAQAPGYTDSSYATDTAATAAAPGDTTAPTVLSLTAIDATTIRVVMSEPLVASLAGWSFKKNGGSNVPTLISGSGSDTLLFTFGTMLNTDTLTASYDSATGATMDLSNNELVSFVDVSVLNQISSGIPTEAILIFQDGQSNARGTATDSANAIAAGPGVYEYKLASDQLVPLTDPTGEGNSVALNYSMNPYLGKRVHELTGKPVIVVVGAVGNTSITTWIDTGNANYINAKARWDGLLAYCAANNITILGKYGHWLQGENDQADAMATDTYVGHLNTLVDLRKSAFGLDKVFCSRVGYIPTTSATAGESEAIMIAQEVMNFAKDDFILATRVSAGFTIANGKKKSDDLHHQLLGLNEEAEDVAQAIQNFRTNNKKKVLLTEPAAGLVPAVDYFDDIYLFRSLKPGVNNSDFNELFGRNNLTLDSGSAIFDGVHGLSINNVSLPLSPTTVRTLTNLHDWTIEITGRIDGTAVPMALVGRSSGNWENDWVWLNGSILSLKGNGVIKSISLTGHNPNQLFNLSIVYTHSDNIVKVYSNGNLVGSASDWAFTEIKLEKILRGYKTTPIYFWEGVVERIRIVKKALSVFEFDRSPNFSVSPLFDYEFPLNSSIGEIDGDISSTMRLYADSNTTTPDYDADGLVFGTTTYKYLRMGQQLNLNGSFTLEFRLKSATGTGLQTFANRGPRPQDTGPYIWLNGAPHNALVIQYGVNKSFTLPGGIDTKLFHTYKIVYDASAQQMQAFVDGVSIGTLSGIAPISYLIQNVGSCHATTASSFTGTIDWFRIKNSI